VVLTIVPAPSARLQHLALLGARVEAVEAEALGAPPQPEVKLGLPDARPMATLMVGLVSVG
jgi:hypothetical protein